MTTTTVATTMSTQGSPSVVFPSRGHQVLSTLVHLLGCTVLAFCFARRFSWHSMSLSRFCTMAIFADSWLFVFSGGVVVSGIGMSLNTAVCLSGIYLCILFYASSKVLIYIYLSEKVHLVWSAGVPISRLKSRIWVLCLIVLLGYGVIFILMLVAKVAYIRPDRTCIIGLKSMATIPLLTYDVFLNIFLTGLFVYPLMSRKRLSTKLHALAKRTSFAAAIALGTSVINILILTLLHGQQLGWVCLASCGFDVTINAIVIFSVSRKAHSHNRPSSGPNESISAPGPAISIHVAGTEPLPPSIFAFSPIRYKKHGPLPPVPLHKKGSRRCFPTESRVGTLSALGDFAETRDEDGQYTTFDSISQREALSHASHQRPETNHDNATMVETMVSPVLTEEDMVPYGFGNQAKNPIQMMPTLAYAAATTTSLEDIKEEGETPVKAQGSPIGKKEDR